MTRARLLLLALVPLLVPACDAGDEDEPQYACFYDYSVYSVSEWGSSFDEYEGQCITVSSPQACDDHTDSWNDCTGGYCSERRYYNVSAVPGTCEDGVGESTEGTCPYTNDGECDEPEGLGYCPEGTDVADCS